MPKPRTEKAHYDTGELARLLGLSRSTVIKMVDRGHLPGYRLPGPLGPRRVPRLALLEWATEHDDFAYVLDAIVAIAKRERDAAEG